MTNTVESMKIRIHKLEEKDAVRNSRIIAKLKRKIRNMEQTQK